MILRHELAHVRRRDGVFQLLHCLALALHWPNPLAWLAVNRMRLSEERAVDDVVLSEGHRPIDYAELLSRFASGTFMNNHTPLHAMAQASTVRKRVSCVLNAKQDRHAPSPWFKVGLSTFLLLGLILLGSLHARATIASDETVNVDAPNAVDRVTLVMKPSG